MSEWRGDDSSASDGASGASDADGGSTGNGNQNRGFNKVEVKRINYDTLQTSLPEAQMRGKQVGRQFFLFLHRQQKFNANENETATIM